jgi:hypothetical protein
MIAMLENKWMTAAEAADIIGCSSAHVRLLAKDGCIISYKAGPRALLVEKKSVEKIAKNPAKTGRPRGSLQK